MAGKLIITGTAQAVSTGTIPYSLGDLGWELDRTSGEQSLASGHTDPTPNTDTAVALAAVPVGEMYISIKNTSTTPGEILEVRWNDAGTKRPLFKLDAGCSVPCARIPGAPYVRSATAGVPYEACVSAL